MASKPSKKRRMHQPHQPHQADQAHQGNRARERNHQPVQPTFATPNIRRKGIVISLSFISILSLLVFLILTIRISYFVGVPHHVSATTIWIGIGGIASILLQVFALLNVKNSQLHPAIINSALSLLAGLLSLRWFDFIPAFLTILLLLVLLIELPRDQASR